MDWLTPETALGAAVPLLGGCIWLSRELTAERKRNERYGETVVKALQELRDIVIVLKDRDGK